MKKPVEATTGFTDSSIPGLKQANKYFSCLQKQKSDKLMAIYGIDLSPARLSCEIPGMKPL